MSHAKPMSPLDRKPLAAALWLFVAVTFLYAISLVVPALHFPVEASPGWFSMSDEVVPGWYASAAMLIFFPGGLVFWLPNVPLLLGMAMLLGRRWRGAMVAGMTAWSLCFIEWLFLLNPWDIFTRLFSFVRSESGALATPLAGYYLWWSSMAVLALGSWYGRRKWSDPMNLPAATGKAPQ